MRLPISAVLATLAAVAVFSPARSNAAISGYTLVVSEPTQVVLSSITVSSDPNTDADTWLSIYVRRNWMSGPGWNVGMTSWNYDTLPTGWYVAWRTYATKSTGFWQQSGQHKKVNLQLVETDMGGSWWGLWVSQ